VHATSGWAVIYNFWHPGALTLRTERQSARMSKITNDGLTRSGTGCTRMATVGVKGLTSKSTATVAVWLVDVSCRPGSRELWSWRSELRVSTREVPSCVRSIRPLPSSNRKRSCTKPTNRQTPCDHVTPTQLPLPAGSELETSCSLQIASYSGWRPAIAADLIYGIIQLLHGLLDINASNEFSTVPLAYGN